MLFRVLLGPDNARRINVTEALNSVSHLKNILQDSLQIVQDFEIQFEDPDFGNQLCNLTDISELPPDRAILKIITKVSEESDNASISSLDTASIASSSSSAASASSSSNVSPISIPLRQRENSDQWPSPFPIPTFSYDVELRLAKGNEMFREHGTLLDVPKDMKMDILNALCRSMFSYKTYQTRKELEVVAAGLVNKHPCLKDPSMGTCYDSWTTRLYYKVGNYRHKLGAAGCSEVRVNQKRTGDDSRNRLKKARRCEVNFLPDIPTGQTDVTLQNEKAALQEEMTKKYPNHAVVHSKMEQTFALRRKEIVDEEPPVAEIMRQWPALFLEEQVHMEFFRITGVNLKETFFSSLDEYTPKIIQLYRSRSGAFGEDLKTLLNKMDAQITNVMLQRKTAALRGLPLFMRESTDSFFKSCLDTDVDVDGDGVNTRGVQIGILTVTEDDTATTDTDANVRCFALIIEEQIVLDDLPDLPTAMAILFGLIYALNMKYPKELKYMFETIQKVFLRLDTKLSARVQSFRNKMLRC